MPSLEAARESLRRHEQEHLLAFYDELDPAQRANLLAQIAEIDFAQLDRLVRSAVFGQVGGAVPEDIAPLPMLPAVPRSLSEAEAKALPASMSGAGASKADLAEAYGSARRRGEGLVSAGRVAALVVAGGDATRLGFAGPKGCLPATPVRRKSLYQVFAEQILAASRRYGSAVPWYVMTSQTNDAATREFFAAHDYFALGADQVFFFSQGWMPSVAADGRLLLAEKHRLATNPDGHGGCISALRRSGALEDMARRGVEYISYFQVDNPLVRCVDPLFIGLHAAAGAEMSAKALPKRHPLERLGSFCVVEGKPAVIEYSDLPEELARATRDDGTLLFSAGSIAIHVFSRAFVERLTADGSARLPFHRALKKVPHVGPAGAFVQPDEPNAVKFEKFVFDALPLAESALVLETLRSEEFSPIKNVTGEDSVATSLRDQVLRAAEWLESAGVSIPRDAAGEVAAAIEISPLFALDQGQLAEKVGPEMAIKPGERAYLE